MNTEIKSQKNLTFREKISIFSCFCLTFTYGGLLLMIGYTHINITTITGIPSNEGIILAIPQSIALIIGSFFVRKLLSIFNTKTILVSGYILAIISTVLLSQIDRMTATTTVSGVADKTHTTNALITYLILNFTFGLGIAFVSPLVNMYISTAFKSRPKTCTRLLSCSNGSYCIGAGIIPLLFASAIGSQTSHNAFADVRIFYYVGIVLTIVGSIVSYFIVFKYKNNTLQMTNKHNEFDENQPHILNYRKLIVIIITMTSLMFFFYLAAETFYNYNFINFFTHNTIQEKKLIYRAIGVFLITQGLYRIFAGTFINPYMRHRNFFLMSALFLIAATIILLTRVTQDHQSLIFLVAVLVGIGLGNTWPILFDFATSSYKGKEPLIGYWISFIRGTTILIGQFIIWIIYHTAGNYDSYNIILALVIGCISMPFLLTILLSWILQHHNNPHCDYQKETHAQAIKALIKKYTDNKKIKDKNI